jgi:hypothetical protein
MSFLLIQHIPTSKWLQYPPQQNSVTLKLDTVCSSKMSEQIQWPHRPYFKHTEDPNLSQTKINSMATCSDTNSKFCFCKGNWRTSVSSCLNLISITSLEKPFNGCCIIYSYCSSLQSQPNYPIVTFRHLFSSALQETVCDRHTNAYFTLVLFRTCVKQLFSWGSWNIRSQTV